MAPHALSFFFGSTSSGSNCAEEGRPQGPALPQSGHSTATPPGFWILLRLEGRATAADLLAKESLQVAATDTGVDLSPVNLMLSQTRAGRGAAMAYTLFCGIAASSTPTEADRGSEATAPWARMMRPVSMSMCGGASGVRGP